jgi:hypothetical protein
MNGSDNLFDHITDTRTAFGLTVFQNSSIRRIDKHRDGQNYYLHEEARFDASKPNDTSSHVANTLSSDIMLKTSL